jgi:hypothetical protein
MAPQVSAYVRLSNPPASIPSYINLDASSEWSKSSLLCTVVESVILPSRLTPRSGRPGSLAELQGILNRTGTRTIFELKARLDRADVSGDHLPRKESVLSRVPSSATPMTAFDLDFTPRGGQATLGRKAHLFSEVDVRRCIPREETLEEAEGMDHEEANIEM